MLAFCARRELTVGSGNTPLFRVVATDGTLTGAPPSGDGYRTHLRAMLKKSCVPELMEHTDEFGQHAMRPGGNTAATHAGMPPDMAAYLGGWAPHNVQDAKYYHMASDADLVRVVRKYLKGATVKRS